MKLRELRRRKAHSMESLAKLAGVSESTIFLIENGKTNPRLFVIRKLSNALEVDPLEVEEFRAVIEGGSR